MQTYQLILFSLLTLLVSYGLSRFLTDKMIDFALKFGIKDIPNERSSHVIPTPRGGGISIVITFLIALAIVIFFDLEHAKILGTFGVSLALISALGWFDDRFSLSAKLRLAIQMIASAVLILKVDAPNVLIENFGPEYLSLYRTLMFLFMVWMTNLYNFMDGIDGLAAIQGITVSGILAGFCFIAGAPFYGLLFIALMGAVGGFLHFNHSPAKIFLGDVGSTFLGFSFGGLILILAQSSEEVISLPTSLILFACFVTDATGTLLRRFYDGKDVLSPHKDHAFQHIVQLGLSHSSVSMMYGLINAFWLFPLSRITLNSPTSFIWCLPLAYAPLAFFTALLNAGGPLDGAESAAFLKRVYLKGSRSYRRQKGFVYKFILSFGVRKTL